MDFHLKVFFFCCDPNDINVIANKEMKDFCIENNIEFKDQTYTGFITHLKNNFLISYVDELKSLKNNF